MGKILYSALFDHAKVLSQPMFYTIDFLAETGFLDETIRRLIRLLMLYNL
ncbi:hypothetical protein ACKW6Q_04885 [Chryseobacterium kwangjuense]|uniref:Uncharacterized protein n=1 Tax=Chryseobacterium kwangjuense TaxID=267125 RepID=A0ABW9JYZ3_9FLAO